MKTVYISNDNKPIEGNIQGIKSIDETKSGLLLRFDDEDKAYRVAQIFMNSGYETVKVL